MRKTIMKAKQKITSILLVSAMLAAATACGKDTAADSATAATSSLWETVEQPAEPAQADTAAEAATEEPAEEQTAAEVPEGMYLSELTGEPISQDIQNQRPIAVMIDNESKALPHYGTADADIVYELMNSTLNDRITRLMAVYKDWGSISQVGSIRSTRPTNILLAAEYNAVLCHDGGPFYNNDWFAKPYGKEHFSGTFSRVSNGKSREFTEYCMTGDLDKNFNNSGYSTEYTDQRFSEDPRFNFTPWGTTVDLANAGYNNVFDVKEIDLPFKHNGSKLIYNEETQMYDYYEYGKQHLDAETDKPLSFKNVIIQDCTFSQLDVNGYLIYNCLDVNQPGYYITEGKGTDIVWTRASETSMTDYFDSNGEKIQMNTGKTYITLVPSDTWNNVTITQ